MQKRVVLGITLVILCLVASLNCSAELYLSSNGYKWKAASYEERKKICHLMVTTFGKNIEYWHDKINDFYLNNSDAVLSIKIEDTCALVASQRHRNR